MILGIRHHGPGSARAVGRALDELSPSVVVIEGPPELDQVAALAASALMEPPVAGLVYDPARPHRAAFYPMAAFSPEWVALRWALARGATVRFADLPAANALAPTPPADEAPDHEAPDHDAPDDEAPGGGVAGGPGGMTGRPMDQLLDPIGALAAAAGYDDAERWWEDAVEQRGAGDSTLARFEAVRAAMAELRAGAGEADLPDGPRTLRREAAMRKVLRAVVRQADGPVAVVCGAFHAPVLHPATWPTQAADNARLKGLPRTTVAATWAPWTSGRLAASSGYGAGVTAPGWYEHLFTAGHDRPDEVVTRWMVRVAGLLRRHGYDASPASAMEATRLAGALAALRARPVAGLAEVSDAAETVLAQGSALRLAAIATELLVGHTLGSVPPETPMVPLAEDLARAQKTLRLKPAAEPKTILVDLRQPAQLARSVLFRRLDVLGIGWAAEVDAGRTGGTFKEAWTLQWHPELAVAVIEASLHGTTVASAAAAKVAADAQAAPDLATLAGLVERCLPAELPEALSRVIGVLSARTAVSADHLAVMGAVEPLARTRRYGDVRGVDTGVVHEVLAALVTRAAIGLPMACAALDDDAASAMRAALEAVERGVSLVADAELTRVWHDALAGLSVGSVHGGVTGRVARILLDAGRLSPPEAAARLQRTLSPATDPHQAAAWLDGFLAGDVVLLLHDPALFGLIDTWLGQLDPTTFDDLLPLVRRTFARFEPAERRRIGELASRGAGPAAAGAATDGWDETRAAPALAAMARLLGLDLEPALEVGPDPTPPTPPQPTQAETTPAEPTPVAGIGPGRGTGSDR